MMSSSMVSLSSKSSLSSAARTGSIVLWKVQFEIDAFLGIQVITSGNIRVANQNVVSKVQQVRYWIPYSCIMRPYIASGKTTNSCNIWAHNALLCIKYPIHGARRGYFAFLKSPKKRIKEAQLLRNVPSNSYLQAASKGKSLVLVT